MIIIFKFMYKYQEAKFAFLMTRCITQYSD
jgi:hypothetical protein